jgi:hypothetical protein
MENKDKSFWIGVGIIAILGVAIVWYMASHPAPVSAPTTTQGGTAASTPASPSASLDEHAAYYDITAAYPASTPLKALPGGADVAAVALMKQWELDTISQFKTDGNFANLSHDDVQMMGLDQNKESLNITYTVTTGARTISYLFTTNEDTHGAHPNTFYHSFSFDTQNGNNLVLGSLFSPTSDYLTALSKAARAALPAVIAKAEGMTAADVDAGMLKDGTAPAPDNFANFMIDGKNLMIIFAPYQVAPYSAGTQRLSIPLSSLSGILKAEYR